MSSMAATTATVRQFQGKSMATITGGLTSSTACFPLLLMTIYNVYFFRDGSYVNQNIRGYFLCIFVATTVAHVIGVVVFGLPSVDNSDNKPFQYTENAKLSNGCDSKISYTDERKSVVEDSTTPASIDEPSLRTPNYTPVEMLKSPRYIPVVLASGLLGSLKYLSVNNLNAMLVSLGLSQYEASLPLLVPVSGIINRPIFGIFADWTRQYFSRAWYLCMSAGLHLMCFLIALYKADDIYVLSASTVVWIIASDSAATIEPAVIADDFGNDVFSVNLGIQTSMVALAAFATQYAAATMYEVHVPDGSTTCFGLVCYSGTFAMSIGVAAIAMLLSMIYFYFGQKSRKWCICF